MESTVLNLIVAYNTDHPRGARWDHRQHYGRCGQSCPCCRAMNAEDAMGCCESCHDFVQILAVSKLWKSAAKSCRFRK